MLLQYWLGLVGTIAIGNGIYCFLNQNYPAEILYKPPTSAAKSSATPLAARLFGVWTILSGVLRLVCAFDLENKSIYWITLLSFILANIHFVSEILVFSSSSLTSKTISPLVVSTVSALWMLAFLL